MDKKTSLTWQLICAWCGPVFLVTFLVFWGWIGHNLPPAGPDLSATQVAAAIVGLNDKSKDPMLPRWTCWYAIWAGLTFLPASLTAFLKTGAFAWNGVASYYFPYFAWLSWFTIFSFFIIRSINRERAALAAV